MESVLLLLLLIASFAAADLPSSIPRCAPNADFEHCIKNVLEVVKPMLASGEFGDGFRVPKMEPLLISRLRLLEPNLNANMTNLQCRGPSTYNVVSVKPDFENLLFEITLLTPKLTYGGKYSMRLRLGPLDIFGNGDMAGVFEQFHSRIKVKFRKENIDGIDYIKLDKLQQKIKIEKGAFNMKNLFNGDPVLGKVGNEIINKDVDNILIKVAPDLERSLSESYSKIINGLLKSVKVEEFFGLNQ